MNRDMISKDVIEEAMSEIDLIKITPKQLESQKQILQKLLDDES